MSCLSRETDSRHRRRRKRKQAVRDLSQSAVSRESMMMRWMDDDSSTRATPQSSHDGDEEMEVRPELCQGFLPQRWRLVGLIEGGGSANRSSGGFERGKGSSMVRLLSTLDGKWQGRVR